MGPATFSIDSRGMRLRAIEEYLLGAGPGAGEFSVQRALASACRSAVRPAASKWWPSPAIIAALSVQ